MSHGIVRVPEGHTCEAAVLICRSSACNAEKKQIYVNKTREHALHNARNASALRGQDGKFRRAHQKYAEPITFAVIIITSYEIGDDGQGRRLEGIPRVVEEAEGPTDVC
jgi:hypothetical protein